MTIQLYDLAGAEEDRRFSPYCWRVRLALLHKCLPFETIAWRMTDKQAIAKSGSEKVPVLTDGDHMVADSSAIVAYLEQTYPDRPSLFGGPIGEALGRFVVEWCDSVQLPAMFRLLATDIVAHLAPTDVDYFTRTREARVGMKLEEFCANPTLRLSEFQASLTPMRRVLSKQPFVCGDAPAWGDYAFFGGFQWARCISPLKLLAEDDPVNLWRSRMFELFDGAAAKAKGYAA